MTDISVAHAGAPVLAAFLASAVEFVEALTIVLAVGTTRGWRSALAGAALGVTILVVITSVFGQALQRIPLAPVQLVIGFLLVAFGLRWLRKAVLRAAGVLPMHDEVAIYARESSTLARGRPMDAATPSGVAWDWIALVTSLKAVLLEGLEVIFIVIAVGAGGRLMPAALGAALAGTLVVIGGIVVRKPLSRVPENTLKYAVGVLLSAFGTFWIGEGAGFSWPGDDLSVIALVVVIGALSQVAVSRLRRSARS